MEVYLSTVVRTAPIDQGGELIRFNWDTKTIENRVAVYPEHPEVDDPNPRGNTRGGRGIALMGDDRLICASYHTLKIFDRDLNELYGITHPMMVNLHELVLDPNGHVFVACTSTDAVLEVDLQSGQIINEYWPRNQPGIQQALNVTPVEIDRTRDNRIEFVSLPYQKDPSHLHINSVTRWGGETYALSNAFGAVLNLDRDAVILHDPTIRGSHNLIVTRDEILINDTLGRRTRIYDRATQSLKQEIDLLCYPEIARIKAESEASPLAKELSKLKHTPLKKAYYKLGLDKAVPALPLFVRGLATLGNMLFVGFSPATIAVIDRPTGDLLDMHQFSDDVRVCVHGLQVAY